jgi:hypothetical protein
MGKTYSVKLVSHVSGEDHLQGLIQQHLQALFNKVFEGTSDAATVAWGAGVASDQIVLHFVKDRASSYLVQVWPDALDHSRQHAGGHTEPRSPRTGSEFYLWVADADGGEPRRYTARGYAKLAFHESIHNQFPYRGDIHGSFGGGGLASLVPQGDLPNDRNIELMRRGMAVKNEQLL